MSKSTSTSNTTRARKGIDEAQSGIEMRRTWFKGGKRPTGFATDESRHGFAPNVDKPGMDARGLIDSERVTADELERIAGAKPARLSWYDFGRIIAAAYAAGGRDAHILDKVTAAAKREEDAELIKSLTDKETAAKIMAWTA